jgi:hypothetical protein
MGFVLARKGDNLFPVCSHNSGLKNFLRPFVTKMPAEYPMGVCDKTNWRRRQPRRKRELRIKTRSKGVISGRDKTLA